MTDEKFMLSLNADYAFTMIALLRAGAELAYRAGDEVEGRRGFKIANLIELHVLVKDEQPA